MRALSSSFSITPLTTCPLLLLVPGRHYGFLSVSGACQEWHWTQEAVPQLCCEWEVKGRHLLDRKEMSWAGEWEEEQAQLSDPEAPPMSGLRSAAGHPRGHVYFNPGLGDFGKPPSPEGKTNNKMSPSPPCSIKDRNAFCFLHRMGGVRFCTIPCSTPLSAENIRTGAGRTAELWPPLLHGGWRSSLVMGLIRKGLTDQLTTLKQPCLPTPAPLPAILQELPAASQILQAKGNHTSCTVARVHGVDVGDSGTGFMWNSSYDSPTVLIH